MRSGIIAAILAASLAACGGPPCRSKDDCGFGAYCVLEAGSSSGECRQDCVSYKDCEQPNPDLATAVCSNEGKCKTVPRPPRIVLFEPESEARYPEGTRSIRVTGEVETAAEVAEVTITPNSEGSCVGGAERALTIRNPTPGKFATLPFVLEGIDVDPGPSKIKIEADIGGSGRSEVVDVRVECPGCATIAIDSPRRRSSAAGLELDALTGSIAPEIPIATWRVHGANGDVIDGLLPLSGGRFSIERLPLFAGLNRVEVVASGVGPGLGEGRCSVVVSSAQALENGLRAMLFWDGPNSDLDLSIVGPGGMYGDPAATLSARSRRPSFGGKLEDDPLGFGPEVATLESLPDGEYGLVVEAVVDGGDFGTDATIRLLADGEAVLARPIGPHHLTSLDGKLWIPGTVVIARGTVTFRDIDESLSASAPPTRPPADWPTFY